MHRYRIAAQISLVLSILNFVLGAPVRIVPEIPEASNDSPPSLDTMGSPQHPPSLEGYPDSDPPASPQHPPSVEGSPHSDTVPSPERSPSSDKATSSGYPTPHLSSFSTVSGNSWMLERPPRLSPGRPPTPYASASDKSLSSHYFSASDEFRSSHASPHDSIPEGSAPENTKFWTQKKLGTLLNVAVIGGLIVLWGLNVHKNPDRRDSGS